MEFLWLTCVFLVSSMGRGMISAFKLDVVPYLCKRKGDTALIFCASWTARQILPLFNCSISDSFLSIADFMFAICMEGNSSLEHIAGEECHFKHEEIHALHNNKCLALRSPSFNHMSLYFHYLTDGPHNATGMLNPLIGCLNIYSLKEQWSIQGSYNQGSFCCIMALTCMNARLSRLHFLKCWTN